MQVKNESSRGKWEAALQDAVTRLRNNRLQAIRLKAAIKIFKGKIATDAPWPKEKAETADAIPAVNRNTVTPNVA